MLHSLWNLEQNSIAVITGFSTAMPPKYRERLNELGLDEGQHIICERKIPFNGPRVYRIGGSVFSIDKEIAKNVEVNSL